MNWSNENPPRPAAEEAILDLVPVLPAGIEVVMGTFHPEAPPPFLGSCCACQTKFQVRSFFSINRKSPAGGSWGCVVCGISGGAAVVVCDLCLQERRPVKWGCLSFPGGGGRAPIELFTEPFGHKMEKHPEARGQ